MGEKVARVPLVRRSICMFACLCVCVCVCVRGYRSFIRIINHWLWSWGLAVVSISPSLCLYVCLNDSMIRWLAADMSIN